MSSTELSDIQKYCEHESETTEDLSALHRKCVLWSLQHNFPNNIKAQNTFLVAEGLAPIPTYSPSVQRIKDYVEGTSTLFNESVIKTNGVLEHFYITEGPKKGTCRRTNKLERVTGKLEMCGKYFRKEISCKHCMAEDHPAMLKVTKPIRYNCQIKYCSHPECKSSNYKTLIEKFRLNKRLRHVRSMYHMVIGFEKVSMFEYETKQREHRKTISIFFKKLKGLGCNANCIIVSDVSKGTRAQLDWDKKYYLHYHIGMLPMKTENYGKFLKACQAVRKKMLSKGCMDFHFQSFGLKSKRNVLSYLSLRAVGLYKPLESEPYEKTQTPITLIQAIKNGKFMLLKDIMPVEKYCNVLYGKRSIWVVGSEINLRDVVKECDCDGLQNGSTIINEMLGLNKIICPRHGLLERCDMRVHVEFCKAPPPPDISQKIKEKLDFGLVETSEEL